MILLFILAGFTFVVGKEHEIVYPRMIISRSGEKRVLFRAFDQDFHLRLEPTDILSDDFVLISRDDSGVTYVKPDVNNLRQSILQDPKIGSTIHVDDSGPLQIKGIINEKLRIRPDPSFNKGYKAEHKRKDRKRYGYGPYHKRYAYGTHYGHLYEFRQHSDEERESIREIPHRVTKLDSKSFDKVWTDEVIPDGIKGNSSNLTARTDQSITVEIIIVTDTIFSKKFSSDNDAVIYLAVLLNSMSLRYRTMPNLIVNYKLVKVKRNMVASDEPYIVNNMYNGLANSEPLLSDFVKYCAGNRDLNCADIVKLITAQSMGDYDTTTKKMSPGVLGIAYVGGCCDKYYKYGISKDSGYDFDGCSTCAHEIAHLLGSPHDGDDPVSYIPGSPGSKECSWDLGYLMSYVRKDTKQFAFSPCSEKCISQLSALSSASCLFLQNCASSLNPTDDRLPGVYYSDSIGTNDMATIYRQRCWDKSRDLLVYKLPRNSCNYSCRTPADTSGSFRYWILQCLDGDQCYPGKTCKNGVCG